MMMEVPFKPPPFCLPTIVWKNSKRIERLCASRPANGSLKINSFLPESSARHKSVRRISPVDINFSPRSRIFSTPQSFTSGKVSSRLAIGGKGRCLCFASGPPKTSQINRLPERPSSILSIYSDSSKSRSS